MCLEADMFRLLIVDDEEIIVNSLYEVFKSLNEIELDVYKAYSAQEAMGWLSRTRIDIVLTDIMMPEMDGLKLLEEIHKRWPFCKVIFLTGYEKFDYIYNALQIKDVGYILKSEDPDKIISAVIEAVKKIQKNNELEVFIHEAKEQINLAKVLFKKDFLNQVLLGNLPNTIDQSVFDELDISLEIHMPVLLIKAVPSGIQKDLSYMGYIEDLYVIKQQIEKNIWMKVIYTIIMDDTHNLWIFVQAKKDSDEGYKQLISFLKGSFELVQLNIKATLGITVGFLIGSKAYSWDNINKGYVYLQGMYTALGTTNLDMIMTDVEVEEYVKEQSIIDSFIYNQNVDKDMIYLIRYVDFSWMINHFNTGNRELYFEKLEEMLKQIRGIQSMNDTIAMEVYYQCALNILKFINNRQITEKLAFRIGRNKLMRVDLHESWKEAVDYLYDISEQIFEVCLQENINREERMILRIQSFVYEHLSEDLSLVRISEHAHMNPSYLSRFYKQKTGENLSDFIDKIRIQKVIDIMKAGNVKIHEIGESVGYENPGSFTRFFKKMTNYTPQEYYERIIYMKWVKKDKSKRK